VVPKGPLAADAPQASESEKAMSFKGPVVLSFLSFVENNQDSDSQRAFTRTRTAGACCARALLTGRSGVVAVNDCRRHHVVAHHLRAFLPVRFVEDPDPRLDVCEFTPCPVVCEQVAWWPPRELLACGDVEANPGPYGLQGLTRTRPVHAQTSWPTSHSEHSPLAIIVDKCPQCKEHIALHVKGDRWGPESRRKAAYNGDACRLGCIICALRHMGRHHCRIPTPLSSPALATTEQVALYVSYMNAHVQSADPEFRDNVADLLVEHREYTAYPVMRNAIEFNVPYEDVLREWPQVETACPRGNHLRKGEAESAFDEAGTPPHPGPPKTNRIVAPAAPLLRVGLHVHAALESGIFDATLRPKFDFDDWFKDYDHASETVSHHLATQYGSDDDTLSVLSLPTTDNGEAARGRPPPFPVLHKSFQPVVDRLAAQAAREKRRHCAGFFDYACALWKLCLAIAAFHAASADIPTALFAPPIFTYRMGEAKKPGPSPSPLECWNLALLALDEYERLQRRYLSAVRQAGLNIKTLSNYDEMISELAESASWPWQSLAKAHAYEQQRQHDRWAHVDAYVISLGIYRSSCQYVAFAAVDLPLTPLYTAHRNDDDRGGLNTTGVNFRHPGPTVEPPLNWADEEASQTSSDKRRTARRTRARVVCVEGFYKDPTNGRCGDPNCIREHFGEEAFDELDRRLIIQHDLCLNVAAYGAGQCRRADCQRVHELPHKYRRVDSPAVNALVAAVAESNATVRRHVAPAAKSTIKRNRPSNNVLRTQPSVGDKEDATSAPPDGNFYLPPNCKLPRHDFATGPPTGALNYVLHLPWEAAVGYSGKGDSLLAAVDELIELHTPTYSLVIPRAEVYLVPLLGSTLLGRGQPFNEIGPSAHTAADVPLRPTNIIVDAADVLTRTPHTNVLHLPAQAVGSVLMAYNRSGNVLAQPTLERLVDNLVKDQKWLARIAAVNPLDCALVPASIREYVMALNTTIGMAEVPTWLNTEDGRIKRMLRSLFRRRNFVPTVKDRFRIAHSRDTGRPGPHYPQMVESERGDNPSVTVDYSHTSYAADEVAMCGGPYTDYLHCGFSLTGVGTSYSNARIAMVPVFDLRLTRHVEPSNPTPQHAEAWRRAQNVYDALIGTPTRTMIDADPLLHLGDDVPITGRVPVVMADNQTRHLSPIFAAWYWHLDAAHRRVYTIVLNDIEREQGQLDVYDNFDNVINKVFVKIEIAPRLLMKAVRPRVITYMEHSRAVKISHEAWHCIEYLKMVMHQTDFPVVDASGLNTADLEWRLRRFLATRREESPYLLDNFQMWLMGDDNIIFLKDALDPTHFYSVGQHYGRQPEVFRAYNVYQLSFCSRDFFRAYDPETHEYFPRLMLKPFKQISKLPYLKIRGGAVANMLREGAGHVRVRAAAKTALANKAVSLFVEYGCDPFMSQLAIDLLKLTDSPIPDRYEAVKYQLDRHEPERRYRLTRQQLLTRNPETDEGFYQTYEIRYGITRGALDMLRETIVQGFRMYLEGGDEMPEIDLSDYPRTLDLDIGPGLNDSEYPFPEGECGGVEIDYAAFDTTTNEDTHNNNFARQRFAFGNRKFTNVLDKVRRNARLEGDNPQQRISARVKYQMLSGHADTSAGNGISNATENIASLVFSYPHCLVDLERIYRQQALRPKLDMREHPTNLMMEQLLPGQAAAEVTDQRSRTRTQRSPGLRAILGRR
jgi:hypothetical protein